MEALPVVELEFVVKVGLVEEQVEPLASFSVVVVVDPI